MLCGPPRRRPRPTSSAPCEPVWFAIREEAARLATNEPLLGSAPPPRGRKKDPRALQEELKFLFEDDQIDQRRNAGDLAARQQFPRTVWHISLRDRLVARIRG